MYWSWCLISCPVSNRKNRTDFTHFLKLLFRKEPFHKKFIPLLNQETTAIIGVMLQLRLPNEWPTLPFSSTEGDQPKGADNDDITNIMPEELCFSSFARACAARRALQRLRAHSFPSAASGSSPPAPKKPRLHSDSQMPPTPAAGPRLGGTPPLTSPHGSQAVRISDWLKLWRRAWCSDLASCLRVRLRTTRLTNTQFSEAELKAIVEEAGAAGTYVCAHAYTPAAIQRAVKCGVASIEHGNYLDEYTARLMSHRRVFLVPTLVTYREIVRHGTAAGMPEVWRSGSGGSCKLVAKVGDAVDAFSEAELKAIVEEAARREMRRGVYRTRQLSGRVHSAAHEPCGAFYGGKVSFVYGLCTAEVSEYV
ncbi:hypothetical protein VOLCADRAFT_100764 [Volvox carteri f. nagariensis]|uniref:Amidohydrolase-related domain-containing protein n=1 Tax=Volvox carteri f. nagariensis TaxID=3068 RepID=D8UKZ0_VOLCA|nr:uncharacterized protein VOLCADRAFT_100764 [Volvox carteri f. nagariensis]EFJ39605.1 hypothetical protein VOLCADRAFT_100764 [Volvox carteri f. nagariensis]|eukprot:XP_002959326.1 hypothetical protein VOLCADRAFT_100764 [Volvox carteri f. nagariensis]